MLKPQNVYNMLKEAGFEFFTGVPDSLLKDFCAYITDHSTKHEHVIAANEGNAIALAAGHYLGKKTPAFVYMQNSGIGNAINPLLSLVGQVGTPNLVHIVINNGAHGSVGGQPTVALEVDLVKVASACGYKNTALVSTNEDLLQFMNCNQNVEGPVFLEVCVNKNSRTDLGRPKASPVENRDAFMKRLGA